MTTKEKRFLKRLGATIRFKRENRGMGITLLAKNAKLDKGHLSSIERANRGDVGIAIIYRISKALKVPMWHLVLRS